MYTSPGNTPIEGISCVRILHFKHFYRVMGNGFWKLSMSTVIPMQGIKRSAGIYVNPLKIVTGLLLIKIQLHMENIFSKIMVSVGCTATVLEIFIVIGGK